MPAASEHTATIGEQLVFWRSAEAPHGSADGPDASAASPALYLHGVPTSSDDWTPFLARTGGLAPDLPGFGRSGKRGDGDYTMAGYDAFVEAFLSHLGVERVRLVVHDWGAAGLVWAQRFPERVERLVVVNAVPLVAGYRWHRVARAWRTRGLGELVMGATTRWSLGRALPPGLRDAAWRDFDPGTQRAILRLYRTSGEDALAAAGARLGAIGCPALVVWGDRDPYIPPRFADAYAAVLGDARAVHLADAGHWPWTDRPDVVGLVAAFLAGEPQPAAEPPPAAAAG